MISLSDDEAASCTRSSPGRCTLPSLTVSSMILSHPARFSASRSSQDSAPLSGSSRELSCPSVRFNARVGTGTEDACLWINGDGRVRT